MQNATSLSINAVVRILHIFKSVNELCCVAKMAIIWYVRLSTAFDFNCCFGDTVMIEDDHYVLHTISMNKHEKSVHVKNIR